MMVQPSLRLRHLSFHGPNRKVAALEFGPGLNVIFGASDTGKSFAVEAIDFMLGGKPTLRDFPERVGYDRILLGMETLSGESFTLSRSVDGSAFKVFDGLLAAPPPEAVEGRELADIHNEKNSNNLSMFLLERCALAGKRVRRNQQGDTNSLSFRNLARLMIVTETEITEQRSPLADGNPTANTPNFATFRLLLTGVDDSALVSAKPKSGEDQSREAQLELLDQLLDQYREQLKEIAKAPEELEDQLQKIETTLGQHGKQLSSTEADYRDRVDRRRELRKRLEEGKDRRSEVAGLLERFALLSLHYQSDLARLRGIEEGGTLFEVMGQAPCPLCGAAPAYHQKDSDCDGNVTAVVAAARSEISKIELLQSELAGTTNDLRREAASFDRRLPKVEEELRSLSADIEGIISPQLARLRSTYAGFADKRGEVREALSLYKTIQDIEARRTRIENRGDETKSASVAEGDLPTSVAEEFAKHIETILKAWHFPEADRVFFDPKSRDLVISGKARGARGKGLRAITHAAFTVGLLDYCKTKETPHPGFVIMDSPLLAYRKPEGSEDDLTGTDLEEKFYDFLGALPEDRQVIVVENRDPPEAIRLRPQSVMFSKNPHSGRYGLFPMEAERPASKNVEQQADNVPKTSQ
jgi:hypothetical protein